MVSVLEKSCIFFFLLPHDLPCTYRTRTCELQAGPVCCLNHFEHACIHKKTFRNCFHTTLIPSDAQSPFKSRIFVFNSFTFQQVLCERASVRTSGRNPGPQRDRGCSPRLPTRLLMERYTQHRHERGARRAARARSPTFI